MGTTASEVRADIIGRIVTHATKRLNAEQLALFTPLVEQYYAFTDAADLSERKVADLYGACMAHLSLATHRQPGEIRVRAYAPDLDRYGYVSEHSVVEVVTDDVPFLVDSVTMELARHTFGLHLVIHPVVRVRRDEAGLLLEVLPHGEAPPDTLAESYMHVEVNRETSHDRLEEVRSDLVRVVGDVNAAVQDWQAMRATALDIAEELSSAPPGSIPGSEAAEPTEVAELLRWLSDGHFIFLGYRSYELEQENNDLMLRAREGSGLGILRPRDDSRPSAHTFATLPAEVRKHALEPVLLNVTKASSRSTVHRRGYLDYIGVKGFDAEGNVVSERRFLGLYTTNVYKQWPQQIPILRRKVGEVVARAGFAPDSHSGKALEEILDSYPRDELFQISADELFDQAIAILGLQDRERLRLLVRRDHFGRFVSCLVFLPRNRLSNALEERIRSILLEAFDGQHLEYAARVGDAVLARLHLVIYPSSSTETSADVDLEDLEGRLADAMRSWSDDLCDVLVEEWGEERGTDLHRQYGEAFPNSYMEDFSARAAVSDLGRILMLEAEGGFTVNLYRPIEATEHGFRLKLYQARDRMTLSSVLPLLENMGLRVAEERPYEVTPEEGETAWIYDFGLRCEQHVDFESDEVREGFHEAFLSIWRGTVDNDSFNRLVLAAGLAIRDVVVLRAYARYLRQAGTTFSLELIASTLANNPALAHKLVELFHCRFDPDSRASLEDRRLVSKQIAGGFERGLDAVANLNEDQVLRRLLGAVQATLRTNFFQLGEDERPKPSLAIKLDPSLVPGMPLPIPMFETFVYSPRVEGTHLRTGKVARGGIRWSDRLEDYRTEILGLMKAQAVKNAVIVPGGAKGGFVVKAPPAGGFEVLQAEAIACYQTFIRALLDVSDNLVSGEVVAPPAVVRHDTDDTYLVVAADKGTATFSDIANAISDEYGFWLGDAFASGGSSGYDHKAMGITARGAFVSVRRHFRDLGVDIDREPITVAGIGDMSGDVFGNGVLLSRHLRLVAAFDHRHIFLDPDPDPEASFAERARLFALPRSSWDDYDRSVMSEGGGVFARASKVIDLSPEAQSALGLDSSSMQPDQVIRAILKAPVDLLWNGGIGTYVKATEETNPDAGDKTNDGVRVDASELRCRVVGEGGNLGCTQRGRIEFALAGGRINTDAIDNSAGVDTSDHEVNIKILLGRAIADGVLTRRQRDELLSAMTNDVTAHVLEDNDGQTQALYNAAAQSLSMIDVHARALSALERGGLNRSIEFLPSDEELRARGAIGQGLTMPELAVLLAYAKSGIYSDLVASDLPEDPYFRQELELYFPAALRERHLAELHEHPLRREIIATRVTNSMVNRGGTTFVFRLAEETGCQTSEIARAHAAAWEMFAMGPLWEEIDGLDAAVPAAIQVELILEGRKLVERATRWILGHRRLPIDVRSCVEDFSESLSLLAGELPSLVAPGDAEVLEALARRYSDSGVPEDLARRIAGLSDLFSGLDLAEVVRSGPGSGGSASGGSASGGSGSSGRQGGSVSGGVGSASGGPGAGADIHSAASVYFGLGGPLWLDWLRDRIVELPREDRWQALARAAVRDDLYSARATMTAEVLRLVGGGGASAGQGRDSGAAHVRSWLRMIGDVADRSLLALDEIAASGRTDLAAVSVALREIHNLLQASGPVGT